MAIAAARRRLWRGIRTAAAASGADAGADAPLLARLVAEPEFRVKATMEEASSSAPHRDAAFWEPLAAALLRASSLGKAHLVRNFLFAVLPIHLCVSWLFYFSSCGKYQICKLQFICDDIQ